MITFKTDTKTNKILRHLKSHKSLTSMEAFELYRATRLSAIIFRLREEGFDINMKRIQHAEANFGKYSMPDTENNRKMIYEYRRFL